MFLLLVLSLASWANTWLSSDKIRASYFHSYQDEEHACLLKKADFNALLVKFGGNFDSLSGIESWAEIAQKYDLHFYPVLNLGGAQEISYTNEHFRREINRAGQVSEKTPCPLDEYFWDVVVKQRLLDIASLKKGLPIDGVIFDTEMYGADHFYYGDKSCFCDNCFNSFLRAKGVKAEVLPEKRWDWLVESGYQSEYFNLLEIRLEQLARLSIQDVRKQYPDFMLGVLHYFDRWFYNGIARAWGTKENPIMLFSEHTYSSGFSSYIPNTQTEIASKSIYAYFIPGIWISKFYPSYLTSNIYYMSEASAGYWLYTSYSLWKDEDRLESGYRIPGTQKEFWEALAEGNQEIAKYAESEGNYQTKLRIEPQPPIVLPLEEKKIDIAGYKPSQLKPLFSDHEYAAGEPKSKLRKKHIVHFIPESDMCILQIIGAQIGRSGETINYIIVNSKGEEVVSGFLSPVDTHRLELAVTPNETYTLLVDPRGNAFSVDLDNKCLVYEASPENKLWLIGSSSPLYFYVPAGCEDFWMHIRADGPDETAQLQIIDPNGKVVKDQYIDEGMYISIEVEEGQEGVWSFRHSEAEIGIVEDVYAIYFSDDIPPYVSDHPNRLVIEK